jgi:tetratricopeptide (TPR) repeat protein
MKGQSYINRTDLGIGIAIISIYLMLIVFGIISLQKPAWLTDLSKEGRYKEASGIKTFGDKQLREKQYDQAIKTYIRALDRYPELTEAIVNLGIAYSLTGETQKAADKYLYSLNNQKPLFPEIIYTNLADLYIKNEDTALAMDAYFNACKTEENPFYAYSKISDIFSGKGVWDSALIYCNLAINFKTNIQYDIRYGIRRDSRMFIEDSNARKQYA